MLKHILLIPILVTANITLLQAQTKPAGSRQNKVPVMATDPRSDKIRTILQESQQQIMLMRADSLLSAEEKKTKFRQLIAFRRSRIDSLLTPAERAQIQRLTPVSGKTNNVNGSTAAQRHEAEMNRIPHKRILKSGDKDTSTVH